MSKNKILIGELPGTNNYLDLLYKVAICLFAISSIFDLAKIEYEACDNLWMNVIGSLSYLIGGIIVWVFFYYISISFKELKGGLSGLMLTFGITFAIVGLFSFIGTFCDISGEDTALSIIIILGIIVMMELFIPLIIGIKIRRNYEGNIRRIGDDFLWYFAIVLLSLRVMLKSELEGHGLKGFSLILWVGVAIAEIVVLYRIMSRLDNLCSGEDSRIAGAWMDMSK